jgi:hypothetical protein
MTSCWVLVPLTATAGAQEPAMMSLKHKAKVEGVLLHDCKL